MKQSLLIFISLIFVILFGLTEEQLAQDRDLQYFRPPDKRGINVFETSNNVPSIGLLRVTIDEFIFAAALRNAGVNPNDG